MISNSTATKCLGCIIVEHCTNRRNYRTQRQGLCMGGGVARMMVVRLLLMRGSNMWKSPPSVVAEAELCHTGFHATELTESVAV